jgi:hypothetical protein
MDAEAHEVLEAGMTEHGEGLLVLEAEDRQDRQVKTED